MKNTNATPIVEMTGVTAGYLPGLPVLREVTFRIDDPITHLKGTNGSGKSTVIEVLAGILEPWRGNARIAGHDAHTASARALRRIVRAEPALLPALTLRVHVSLMTRSLGVDADTLSRRMVRHGLVPWLDTPTGELSTWNLRKAWWVLTTSSPAPLMIADEPFSGVDASGVDAIVEDIRGWAANGLRTLLVTHDLPPLLADLTVITLPTWTEALPPTNGRTA